MTSKGSQCCEPMVLQDLLIPLKQSCLQTTCLLNPCFLKCGPWTSSISNSRECTRKNIRAWPQTYRIRNSESRPKKLFCQDLQEILTRNEVWESQNFNQQEKRMIFAFVDGILRDKTNQEGEERECLHGRCPGRCVPSDSGLGAT